jgi:outer membrane protein assembly factor BamB
VSNGRVYTAGWSGGQDTVYCFDENATGDDPTPLWSESYSCGSVSYQGMETRMQ